MKELDNNNYNDSTHRNKKISRSSLDKEELQYLIDNTRIYKKGES